MQTSGISDFKNYRSLDRWDSIFSNAHRIMPESLPFEPLIIDFRTFAVVRTFTVLSSHKNYSTRESFAPKKVEFLSNDFPEFISDLKNSKLRLDCSFEHIKNDGIHILIQSHFWKYNKKVPRFYLICFVFWILLLRVQESFGRLSKTISSCVKFS